jgi:carbon-monoxide dehydrogenase medium subunit
MHRFDYYRPESLKEAYGLMDKWKGKADYIAGGTDIIVRIKQGIARPDALVSLRCIAELQRCVRKGGLLLGSMTRFRDIERDPFIALRYPALKAAAGWLANPQVRNVATLGGNICNAAPSADAVPPLLVMSAVATVEGPGGTREIPLERFFQGPGKTCLEAGDILTAVRLPETPGRSGSAFMKTGRVTQDLAVANAAAFVAMEGDRCRECRLAAGAVAPVPLRLRRAEAVAVGRKIDRDLLDQVAETVSQEVSPISDVRGTEAYRRVVAGVLVKRAIEAAVEVATRSQ